MDPAADLISLGLGFALFLALSLLIRLCRHLEVRP